MKFEIDRMDFLNALDDVSKVFTNNADIPFMHEVMLKSMSDAVKLTCNKYGIYIQIILPAQILEPGKILVDVSDMCQLLRTLGGQSVLIADTMPEEEISLIIYCETSSVEKRKGVAIHEIRNQSKRFPQSSR